MPSDQFAVNVEAAIYRDDRWLMIERGAAEEHAPGTLSMVGGTVEHADAADNVLEEALRREILEEVGSTVKDDLRYVESKSFISDSGCRVIDIVFLAEFAGGEPRAILPDEVAAVHWMTLDEIIAHPKTPEWINQSMKIVEKMRLAMLSKMFGQ